MISFYIPVKHRLCCHGGVVNWTNQVLPGCAQVIRSVMKMEIDGGESRGQEGGMERISKVEKSSQGALPPENPEQARQKYTLMKHLKQ